MTAESFNLSHSIPCVEMLGVKTLSARHPIFATSTGSSRPYMTSVFCFEKLLLLLLLPFLAHLLLLVLAIPLSPSTVIFKL